MSDKNIKRYTGKNATITWNKQLCIHAAECVRAEGELFDLKRKPWIDPDTGTREAALDIVGLCPTGALSIEYTDAGDPQQAERSESRNTITVTQDGPLMLRGELNIDGAPEDSPGLKFRASLCRCGLSQNKPYCDNTHAKSDFSDAGNISDTGTAPENDGGPLNIAFKQNAPMFINGNLHIVSADGQSAWQGTKAVLCRCGHSKNKPFCDGTHRTEQWQSE